MTGQELKEAIKKMERALGVEFNTTDVIVDGDSQGWFTLEAIDLFTPEEGDQCINIRSSNEL